MKEEQDGSISRPSTTAKSLASMSKDSQKAVWKKRATNADLAIQAAWKEMLPIRVVVCEGKMRDRDDPDAKPSVVHKRLLDPLPWAVIAYDVNNGECTLARGAARAASVSQFVDQFSVDDELHQPPELRHVSGDAFVESQGPQGCPDPS